MLSIVIPTLNSSETLDDCLSSIIAAEIPNERFEILVVDGGSTDATLEIARGHSAKILICRERGIGPARNLGLRNAKGEIVCFTDSDCIVEKGWLMKISNFLCDNPDVDGVGGCVLWYEKKATRLQELAGKIFVEDQNFPDKEIKTKAGSFDGVLFDVNCAYRRENLLEAGGFPEPVGLGHELSWKLAGRGKVLIFCPSLRVFHIFPSGLRRLFRQQFKWGMYISVLKNKYFSGNSLGDWIFMVFSIMKSFFLLLDFRSFSLRVFRFCESLYWWSGRVYAYQFRDFDQIPLM
jgi:glycosyltransferase involved in cell wall biosynthesis